MLISCPGFRVPKWVNNGQKDNLAAKVKEEQSLRASLPALFRQILELVKTHSEITVKEI